MESHSLMGLSSKAHSARQMVIKQPHRPQMTNFDQCDEGNTDGTGMRCSPKDSTLPCGSDTWLRSEGKSEAR